MHISRTVLRPIAITYSRRTRPGRGHRSLRVHGGGQAVDWIQPTHAQKGGRTSEARPSEMKLFATDRIVEYSSSGGTCEVKPAHVTQQ